MIRKANAVWKGDGRNGTGTLTSQSGVLSDSPYGYKTRFENEPGTNPEELIAAAHAGCFSMALAFGLQAAGFTAEELRAEAAVSLDPDGDGFKISRSALTLKARIPGIEDLALTTNASLLAGQARALREAGLRRITVSLDALEPAAFARMSGGRGEIGAVLDGIAAAEAAGFDALKINCVVQRGANEDQVLPLLERFRGSGHVVRFIEYMDVGTCNGWDPAQVVSSRELRDRIAARWPLRPLQAQYRGEVAERYAFVDGGGEVGFVSSISAPFCGDCHRARVSADGRLYTCLFAGQGHDLRPALAQGEAWLAGHVAGLWGRRGDRYSEIRGRPQAPRKHIEMYLIGG